MVVNPSSAKKSSKVKVTFCQRAPCLQASPFPYNFSISPTCGFGFAFEDVGTCFHVEYTPHPAGLKIETLIIIEK